MLVVSLTDEELNAKYALKHNWAIIEKDKVLLSLVITTLEFRSVSVFMNPSGLRGLACSNDSLSCFCPVPVL
jgi:hypothetical protein